MVNNITNASPINYKTSQSSPYSINGSRNLSNSLATTMPSDRQSSIGVSYPEQSFGTNGSYEKWKRSRIFNPKQSPSAITTENYLKAKSDFSPIYMHNIAITKKALTSIMMEGKPRYAEKVNILA